MAAQPSQDDFFSFVGGLNTEGGFFLTPKNTWKDGDNIIPQRDGSIQRRNAVVLETGYSLSPESLIESTVDSYAFSSHLWQNVDGDGNRNILVAQFGNIVYFYDASNEVISTGKYTFQLDLNDYKAFSNESLVGSSPISCADCYGKLVIASQDTDPVIIMYESDTVFKTRKIEIKIRDFDGITSDFPPNVEKTKAEWEAVNFFPEALYNLYNQGWDDEHLSSYAGTSSAFPSNTKQQFLGKNSEGNFDKNVLNKIDFGNSPAPKGKVILDAFVQDRYAGIQNLFLGSSGSYSATISAILYRNSSYLKNYFSSIQKEINELVISADKYRPSCCSFFAGRVWYSGVPSGERLGWVLFSQIVTDISKIEKCYQENDPTSEVMSDLLDTDGGLLQIPEAGVITGLQPIGKGLLVFATNGVWCISGADAGFTATNYSIDKVSNNGCFSPQSIVKADEFIYYWGNTGIFKIGYDSQIGVQVASLSDTVIKSYFSDIPVYCRKYVEGKYNESEKVIYWLYSTNQENKFRKNKLICFDTYIGCFYTQTIDNSSMPIIVSVGVTKENTSSEFVNVIGSSNTQLIVDDSGNQVVASIFEERGGEQRFKFITLVETTSTNKYLTFSNFSTTRDSFKDWGSVELDAYVITGYNLASSGPTKAKTGNYLSAFLKRTEEVFDANAQPTMGSSCMLQTRWDFTDNTIAGKWSDSQQLYRINRVFFGEPSTDYENGYPLVITKNKLRGRGKSIQMKYSSSPNKDMKLVGWSATFTSNSNV